MLFTKKSKLFRFRSLHENNRKLEAAVGVASGEQTAKKLAAYRKRKLRAGVLAGGLDAQFFHAVAKGIPRDIQELGRLPLVALCGL